MLDDFAELCPQIEEVALPATDGDLRTDILTSILPLTQLQTLDIFGSELAFPQTVAIYLSARTTPRATLYWQDYPLTNNARYFTAVPDRVLDNFKRWCAVELALNALHTVGKSVVRRTHPGWRALGVVKVGEETGG